MAFNFDVVTNEFGHEVATFTRRHPSRDSGEVTVIFIRPKEKSFHGWLAYAKDYSYPGNLIGTTEILDEPAVNEAFGGMMLAEAVRDLFVYENWESNIDFWHEFHKNYINRVDLNAQIARTRKLMDVIERLGQLYG